MLRKSSICPSVCSFKWLHGKAVQLVAQSPKGKPFRKISKSRLAHIYGLVDSWRSIIRFHRFVQWLEKSFVVSTQQLNDKISCMMLEYGVWRTVAKNCLYWVYWRKFREHHVSASVDTCQSYGQTSLRCLSLWKYNNCGHMEMLQGMTAHLVDYLPIIYTFLKQLITKLRDRYDWNGRISGKRG